MISHLSCQKKTKKIPVNKGMCGEYYFTIDQNKIYQYNDPFNFSGPEITVQDKQHGEWNA